MSVYYEIKEHLVITDRMGNEIDDVKNDVVGNMQMRMAALGSLMLLDEACINMMTLTADKQDYSFSGKAPSADLKEAILAMENAQEIDLVIEYGFYWRSLSSLCEMVMPFSLTKELEKLSQNDMNGIFYSMWNKADCAGDEGILSAYGVKGGEYYSGQVAFSKAATLPNGIWTADTDACISINGQPGEEVVKRVLAVVEELKGFADVNEYSDGPDYKEFILNNVSLKSADDVYKLLQSYSELNSLPSVTCGLIGEYVDVTGADVRRMNIDYNADRGPIVFIAEV